MERLGDEYDGVVRSVLTDGRRPGLVLGDVYVVEPPRYPLSVVDGRAVSEGLVVGV